MSDDTCCKPPLGQAFSDHGLAAAITALIGGLVALIAASPAAP